MSATVTIGAILLQLGAGYINSRRQCKLSNDMAAAQKDFEEKATLHGIENARNEYRQLCGLQREIEIRMQQDRIQQIRDNFYSSLDIIAYSESLRNFPLLVPPFVMKNESLPLLSDEFTNNASKEKVAMHCILTNCTDTQFNVKIFPELEERLSGYFCEYWNIGSPHSILFYQGGWKDSTKDARPYISNLKSELRTLPTLVISPVITESDGLQFLFSCWGMGTEQEFSDNSVFVPKGLKFEYKPNHPYSEEEKESILNELVPSLEAFISFFADVYYWLYYGTPPLLPSLIKNEIKLKIVENVFMCQYETLLESSISDSIVFNAHPERIIYLIKSLPNLCDKRNKCLKIWKKRFLKDYEKESDSINALLDLNLYSNQDIPFLTALVDIFPEHNKTIIDLRNSLCSQRIPQVRGICNDTKYNRRTNYSYVTVEDCGDKKETSQRTSKYNF